jgi:hypothetical protein
LGNFVQGPVIAFSFDSAGLSVALQTEIQKAAAQLTRANRKMATDLAKAASEPLQQQAAKLRALYSTGTIGIKDLQVEQKKFITLLDSEISRLVQKNDLTKQELSTLKQVTLERERQANALQRGVGVGVTSGTQSALALASGTIVNSIQRNVGQLGARLIGLAGGSGAGEFSAAAAGIAQVSAAAGPAAGIVGAFVTALVAGAVAAGNLAVKGGDLAERLSNISQSTGISIQNLQALGGLAQATNLDLDDLVTGFRKFSQAVTGGAGGEAGGFEGAGQKSAQVLKILGVNSKDPIEAINEFADAIQKLPDGFVKTTTVTETWGKSALKLIPIFNQGREGVAKYLDIVKQFAPEITDGVLKSQNDWNDATVKFTLSLDKLKVAAVPFLDVLAKITTGLAEVTNATISGDTKGLSGFEKTFLFLANPAAFFGLGLAADGTKKVATETDKLNKIFQVGETILARQTEAYKKLVAQQNGSAEAAKKLREEGAKELAALNEEIAKQATNNLQQINTAAQGSGLSPVDTILHKQLEDLQKIAEAVLQFPELVQQAGTAVKNVTDSTLRGLEKITDESLKKINDDQDKDFGDQVKRQQDLAKIIKDTDDQLAIDRAASTLNGVAKIIAEEQKRLGDTIQKATELGATKKQHADLRVKINQDAQAQIAKLRAEDLKKTQEEIKNTAGRLFDALVSGTKSFGAALKQALLAAALTPVKLLFEAVVTAIFTPIVTRVKDAIKGLGDSLKSKGGILGDIGKILSPDASGIDANTQVTTANTAATSANTDALTALLQSLGTGTGGSGAGGLLSGLGLKLFSNSGTDVGLGPDSGSPDSETAHGFSLGDAVKTIAGVAAGIGNIVSGKNAGVKIGGAVTTAGGAISGIGAGLNNAALQKFGAIGQGAGLVISGVSQGGVKGVAESTLGGAEVGTAIAPGIGTAIGAAVGFVAGLVGALFGHHGPTQAQIASAIKKQTIDSSQFTGVEFDRSSQGTFGQTLNTGFLEGPGGNFSNFTINGGPRQAPVAVHFTINAIDSKNVKDFLDEHGGAIAQQVASQASSVRSGIGTAVRQAVHPA